MSMQEFDEKVKNVISTLQICGVNGWHAYRVVYHGWYIIALHKANRRDFAGWIIRVESDADVQKLDNWLDNVR